MAVARRTREAADGAAHGPVSRHTWSLRRKSTVWLSLLVAVAAATTAVFLPAVAGGASPTDNGTLLAHLAWGEGDDQVGLVEARESLTRGPEALAVAPDGRVVILDSVNGRLVLLDPEGTPMGLIGLELAQPRFLAVDDQTIHLLDPDVDMMLATYSWSGDLTGSVALSRADEVVTGLFATEDGPFVEVGHRESFLVTDGASDRVVPGRPLDPGFHVVADVTYRPSDGFRVRAGAWDKARRRIARASELRPALAAGRSIEHLVSVDADASGGLLVGARLMQPETKGGVRNTLALTRVPLDDPSQARGRSQGRGNGQPPGNGDEVLLLAESDFAYLGQPYVVSPDGRVFQPIADEAGYSILVHSFQEVQP